MKSNEEKARDLAMHPVCKSEGGVDDDDEGKSWSEDDGCGELGSKMMPARAAHVQAAAISGPVLALAHHASALQQLGIT